MMSRTRHILRELLNRTILRNLLFIILIGLAIYAQNKAWADSAGVIIALVNFPDYKEALSPDPPYLLENSPVRTVLLLR